MILKTSVAATFEEYRAIIINYALIKKFIFQRVIKNWIVNKYKQILNLKYLQVLKVIKVKLLQSTCFGYFTGNMYLKVIFLHHCKIVIKSQKECRFVRGIDANLKFSTPFFFQ